MTNVGWIVDLEVQAEATEIFHTLTLEMVADASKEPGCITYQRFISSDHRIYRLLEVYTDCDAARLHLENFRSKFEAQFSALIHRRSFWVFGSVDGYLTRELEAFGAQFHPHIVGFSCRIWELPSEKGR
jgi:quinol monooxygenase YgiN